METQFITSYTENNSELINTIELLKKRIESYKPYADDKQLDEYIIVANGYTASINDGKIILEISEFPKIVTGEESKEIIKALTENGYTEYAGYYRAYQWYDEKISQMQKAVDNLEGIVFNRDRHYYNKWD